MFSFGALYLAATIVLDTKALQKASILDIALTNLSVKNETVYVIVEEIHKIPEARDVREYRRLAVYVSYLLLILSS